MFTNSCFFSTFVNSLTEVEKQIIMTNLSMATRGSIHRHLLNPYSNKPDKAYLHFRLIKFTYSTF